MAEAQELSKSGLHLIPLVYCAISIFEPLSWFSDTIHSHRSLAGFIGKDASNDLRMIHQYASIYKAMKKGTWKRRLNRTGRKKPPSYERCRH